MNRRKLELLFGLVSGAVGLAAALYTAVIATIEDHDASDPPAEAEKAAADD